MAVEGKNMLYLLWIFQESGLFTVRLMENLCSCLMGHVSKTGSCLMGQVSEKGSCLMGQVSEKGSCLMGLQNSKTSILVPIDVLKRIIDKDAAKIVDGLAPKVADRKCFYRTSKEVVQPFL